LAKKIEKGKLKNFFTARDVYRAGWHGLKIKEEILEGIEILIDHEWVREIQIEGAFQQKGKTVFEINPILLESYGQVDELSA
jgi:hypothetical protein